MKAKNILVYCLSLIIGLLFILSAWFKLFPIEPFEYKIVGTTFFGWTSSVFIARMVIAIEFGIGFLLISSYQLKTSIKFAITALLLFSLHLIMVLILQGNSSDCGCMGSLISLTPMQGLIKNGILLVLCAVVYKHAFLLKLKWKYMVYYVFLISTVSVFIVNPVDLQYSEKYLNKPFDRFNLNLDTLYNLRMNEKVEKVRKDLRHTKTILAFVSASCPHCKVAAKKMSVIYALNPSIPFYIFINGDDADIEQFLKSTETNMIPHSKLNGQLFVEMAGLKLPVIYYYNRGVVEQQVDYFTLEQSHIEKWLKK